MKESIEIKEKLSEDSKGSCRRIRDRKPERRRVIKEQRCKNKGKNILRAEKRKGLCMGFAAGLTAAALLGREMPADRAQARETQPAIGGMSAGIRKLIMICRLFTLIKELFQ